jgi:hypothetical protein
MKNFKKKNILFVVCHPDDEVLWCGGLIYHLSKIPYFNINVICLSGRDINSPRELEFNNAMKLANVHNSLILGGPLRKLLEPLPFIPDTTQSGLNKLGINISEIDLLITHSPYGDEHLSPHHRQANKELYYWCIKYNISFAYFSLIPLPFFKHKSVLYSLKREKSFFLLNSFKVHINILKKVFFLLFDGGYMLPKYYSQFLVDHKIKNALLECYRSINLEMHRNGYAMFDSNCESLYFIDSKGYEIIHNEINKIETPGAKDLFKEYADYRVLLSKIYRKYFYNIFK